MQEPLLLTPDLEIPEDIICPITRQIMTDPVILMESGNTYEREALLKWLEKNKRDPLTNEAITDETIAPNRMAKRMIVSFLDKHKKINPDIAHETYLPESLIQALITSIEKNDIQQFAEILQKDARLLSNDLKDNKNLFLLACEMASFEILDRVLLQLGDKVLSFPLVKSDKGLSLLLSVSRRLDLAGAKRLAKAFGWEPSDAQALLAFAIKENDIVIAQIALQLEAIATPECLNQAYAEKKREMVKVLVRGGVSLEQEDAKGHNFLMCTLEDNETQLTQFLLTDEVKRINLQHRNKAKQSALHLAVLQKQREVVQLLLDQPSVEINQTDGEKNNALHLAVGNGDQGMVELLLKRNIVRDESNAKGHTAVDMAYQPHDEQDFVILKQLVQSGAAIGHLLLKAIEAQQLALFRYLLTEASQRIDPNLKGLKGESALMLAIQGNQLEMASLLLKHPKINVCQIDEQGNTGLHHAAQCGNKEMVNVLMKQSLSIKDKNQDQKTPIQLAREQGHKELANWMEEKHRYQKVKPFLKPMQVKFQIEIEQQNNEIRQQANEIEQQKKMNQQLQHELITLKNHVMTQQSLVDKFSIFSDQYSQAKAEKNQRKQQQREEQQREQQKQNQLIDAWLKGDLASLKKLECEGISLLSPDEKSLRYTEQVERTSKAVQGKLDASELTALLKWVTEGHLVEVETLLKKAPIVLLGTGTVKDLSDRTFKNITALQYAAWSLDIEMCELIIQYLGAHNASIQLKALSTEPDCYSTYGARYDMTPLITKTQTYVAHYAQWDATEQYRYWQKELGGEQRKCPAWLIYAWSEEGSDVGWTKKDASRKITREYDKHRLVWWMTENYNSGRGVGSSWAAARGSSRRGFAVYSGAGTQVSLSMVARHDGTHLGLLSKHRCDALQRVEASVDSQLLMQPLGMRKGQ